MGITTTYKCDRCSHEQNKAAQMWYIGISRQSVDNPNRSYGTENVSEREMWCRACVEELHLLPRSKEDEKKTPIPQPKPTLDEMIREIVAEEIHNG